eukprot:gene27721-36542_t
MSSLLDSSAEAIRNGGSVADDGNTAETANHPFWELFAKVTGPLGKPNAVALVKQASYAFGTQILDIASGSGIYGFTISKLLPNSHVTLLDYENVLEQTKKNANIENVDTSRVSYFSADIFQKTCAHLAPRTLYGRTRFFSMIMLVWSKKGKAYPVDEVEAMLSSAGF